jgi:hypothetical protein
MEDLSWFRHAWEDHQRQFYSDLPEKNLIELTHRYCITVGTGKVIEGSKNLIEV